MIKGSFAKEARRWRDSSIFNGFLVSKITVVLFRGSNSTFINSFDKTQSSLLKLERVRWHHDVLVSNRATFVNALRASDKGSTPVRISSIFPSMHEASSI